MIVTPITPRVSETDGAGHINNCFVPIWFEAGRREIFKVLNPSLDFKQWRAVLVNMNIDYEAQIFYADEVEVHTWIEKIGTKSFTVGEEVWQSGNRCAFGQSIYVYFDHDTQKSATIPSHLVTQFDRFRRGN